MKTFQPLLASAIESQNDLLKLPYPMIGSPKVDGVRCFIHPELGPVTRSLKPIPNHHIRAILSHELLKGLDGEITLGLPNVSDCFAKSISAVMSRDGLPNFTYHVFDYAPLDITQEDGGPQMRAPYQERLQTAKKCVAAFETLFPINFANSMIRMLEYFVVNNLNDVNDQEEICVEDGYEGLMLRRSDGKYKFGRSTLKEAILLKLKRFKDDEATIVGFEALERNTNSPTRNALGLQERSSHKAGRISDSLLGNLVVHHHTFGQFSIGSGFDVSLRTEIWESQADYLGKKVTFKYQETGIVDKPRFPIFKGFRPEE